MPEQRNPLGILGDGNLRGPVVESRPIDEKGRDSRRAAKRYIELLDEYRDRIIRPDNPSVH